MSKEESRWKWGVVYFNREDARVLVPLRFKLGLVLNFGQRRKSASLRGCHLPR